MPTGFSTEQYDEDKGQLVGAIEQQFGLSAGFAKDETDTCENEAHTAFEVARMIVSPVPVSETFQKVVSKQQLTAVVIHCRKHEGRSTFFSIDEHHVLHIWRHDRRTTSVDFLSMNGMTYLENLVAEQLENLGGKSLDSLNQYHY